MTTALAKAPEKIAGYEVHPLAARLPMMSEAELNDLVERIRANGQREPAVLLGGQLLDGRNRGIACDRLGRALAVREATAEERASPLAFVLDENLGRRHLNQSQRALIAAESLPELEAEARARQVALLRRGTEPPSGPQGTNGDAARQDSVVSGFEAKKQERGRARDLAAAAARVGARSVARAKALVEQAPPEVVEDIRAGRTTLKRAEKDLRRAKQLEQIREYTPPAGQFPVIATDPPWKYDDQLDGSDAVRGGCPYPPMELEEICALKVPAAKDCILWMWVTNTVLLEGWHKQVLDAWGFTPKTIYTWDKVDFITGHYGRNVTEHVILAVRGKPVGTFERDGTLFSEKRSRVHSKKPEVFYALVERTCPAPAGGRLEMFARAAREGWVTTGAELPKDLGAEVEAERLADLAAEIADEETFGRWIFEWRGQTPRGKPHAFGVPPDPDTSRCGRLKREAAPCEVKSLGKRHPKELCSGCRVGVEADVRDHGAVDPLAPPPLGTTLLSQERFTGEAQDVGFTVRKVASRSLRAIAPFFLVAKCGAKKCGKEIRIGLTGEGLVQADQRLRLRDHAATHKAKAEKKKKLKRKGGR